MKDIASQESSSGFTLGGTPGISSILYLVVRISLLDVDLSPPYCRGLYILQRRACRVWLERIPRTAEDSVLHLENAGPPAEDKA